MKFVALIAAAILVASSAFAGPFQTDISHPVATCDNDGRCTTRGASTHHSHQRELIPPALDANGNGVVRSSKTGARARVAPRYRAAFQAYVDDLEAHGATIKFMGGIRPGRCWVGGMHPCGKALDVCQRRRGVVDSSCHLPGQAEIAAIAARHGLFEGGQWCRSDYGHAQVVLSAEPCAGTYSARRHGHHDPPSQ